MANGRWQSEEEGEKMIGDYHKYFTKSSYPLKQDLPLYVREGGL